VPVQAGLGPERSSKARVISKLQQRSKLGNASASDEVESLRFKVRWEPARGALGVLIPVEEVSALPENELNIVRAPPLNFYCFLLSMQDADNLDFEALLYIVLERHTQLILKTLQFQLQQGTTRTLFSPTGIVSLVKEGNYLFILSNL
jgi:mediator of RNA polymerase II transcription subunit 14